MSEKTTGTLPLDPLRDTAREIRIDVHDTQAGLQAALKTLAAFCDYHGAPAVAQYHLQVVVDELVTNVFTHGYGGGSGRVSLAAQVADGTLELEVRDEAARFNLLEASTPDVSSNLEQRSIGGLGIHIVRSLVDEIEYERNDGNNVLRLRKRLPSPSGR